MAIFMATQPLPVRGLEFCLRYAKTVSFLTLQKQEYDLRISVVQGAHNQPGGVKDFSGYCVISPEDYHSSYTVKVEYSDLYVF